MYSDDEDYMYNEEQEYLPEVNIFERGEIINENDLENIAREAGIYPEQRKKNDKFNDKVWRFYLYTNAAAYRLIGAGFIPNVREREVSTILKQIRLIKNPSYKNPDAFVLGYAVTKSRSIDLNVLNNIIKRLPEMNIARIKPSDIIRYSRLWLKSF